MSIAEQLGKPLSISEPRFAMRDLIFGFLAVASETTALAATSMLAGYIYHAFAYGTPGPVFTNALVGVVAGLAYAAGFTSRGTYTIDGFLGGARQPSHMFLRWNTAILALALIAFLTKTTSDFSRGWLILFYLLGLVTVISVDAMITVGLRAGLRSGRIGPRRLMLIGTDDEIRVFSNRFTAVSGGRERPGVRVVAISALPVTVPAAGAGDLGGAFRQSLETCVARARDLAPDDIVLLKSWTETEAIAEIVDAMSVLPISIHLDGGDVLNRFAEVRVTKVGSAATLSLTTPPLSPIQMVTKRAFDLVVGSLALLALTPLLIAVGIMIKREDGGAIFFRQRRLGFNQREFRIYKFRSMMAEDDGAVVEQATAEDERFTRIGRFIRRWNIDELPQLINVLRGEMSLVGPRPHAIAHDREFEKRILRYPRRLNVKPGISGWAQVNGLRGATDTDEKMARRVEYDLYYIDNWSIAFDVYILALTAFSPTAYQNAV